MADARVGVVVGWLFACVLAAVCACAGETPEVQVGFEVPAAPTPPAPPAVGTHLSAGNIAATHDTAGNLAGPPSPDLGIRGQSRGITDTVTTGRELLERAASEAAGSRPLVVTGAPAPPSPHPSPDGRGREGGGVPAAESSRPLPARATEEVPAFRSFGDRHDYAVSVPEAAAAGDTGWRPPSTARVLGSLLLVAAAVFGALYALRRFHYGRLPAVGAAGLMQVLGRVQVEPGRSLVLVKVADRILVLGSTREGLSRLAEITDKREVEEIVRTSGQGVRADAFADILKSRTDEGQA